MNFVVHAHKVTHGHNSAIINSIAADAPHKTDHAIAHDILHALIQSGLVLRRKWLVKRIHIQFTILNFDIFNSKSFRGGGTRRRGDALARTPPGSIAPPHPLHAAG